MDIEKAMEELETLAKKVGVMVNYHHLTGDAMSMGGLCKFKGNWRVIIESRASMTEKLTVLAKALSRFDTEELYLSPGVREILERHKAEGSSGEQPLGKPTPQEATAASEGSSGEQPSAKPTPQEATAASEGS